MNVGARAAESRGSSAFLIDAYDLGLNEKGIHRVLMSLVPELVLQDPRCMVATTETGARLLRGSNAVVAVVPVMRKSVWEQWGLPRTAHLQGAVATYSHREAGALWGPPLVLHVPEDPEVRWAREPAGSATARARRAYSRGLMGRSLRRARVAAASVPSIATDLAREYDVPKVCTIPLGVDLQVFRPAANPGEGYLFHLGSPDPRDRTDVVVNAYVRARSQVALPPLVLGGSLGDVVGMRVADAIARHDLSDLVSVTGRLTDVDLAERYRNAMIVVQPAADEGFGLQPLEALASGAPLIVASARAVQDVVGSSAVVVNEDEASLASALVQLASDPTARECLRDAGPVTAAAYTWRGTAAMVLDSLARAASR